MEIRGDEDVINYIKITIKTIDGFMWVIICFLSVLIIIDINWGYHFFHLTHQNDGVSTTLLLTYPLMFFIFLLRLRQFPFGHHPVVPWVRALILFIIFLFLNF